MTPEQYQAGLMNEFWMYWEHRRRVLMPWTVLVCISEKKPKRRKKERGGKK